MTKLPVHVRFAGIAQLVEHNLAKVGVASSSLVSRSKFHRFLEHIPSVVVQTTGVSWFKGSTDDNDPVTPGWVAEWLCSGLQIRVPRFDSGPSLHYKSISYA